MDDLASLRAAMKFQIMFCEGASAPFYARLLEQVLAELEEGGAYARAFAPWRGVETKRIFDDAAVLRLLAAFHYLSLSGRDPDLAALFPPNPMPEGPRLAAALRAAMTGHPEVVARFMASPPQTNEIGRALCLVGGFLMVAKATGLPLRCFELGASAGLNMNWDRYGYRFGGGATWGPGERPLILEGAWTGGAPPVEARVEIASRAACDQNPIDLTDPDQALALQSYVWPDQPHRLERLRAAIALKQATGGAPDRADAADWAEAHVAPVEGAATIVYHSVFLQYPPAATQARIRAAIEAAGARASAAAPLAWLSMEPAIDNPAGPMEVRLRLWPDGGERVLALVHPHGASVNWLA